jgi:NAD(P)-dependent dehydrogenase (short-subunit alcohol dehydrogenase family)
MHITFEGTVAMVTGAFSGIALATTKAFALTGASVVADHNEKLVNEAEYGELRRDNVPNAILSMALSGRTICLISGKDEAE